MFGRICFTTFLKDVCLRNLKIIIGRNDALTHVDPMNIQEGARQPKKIIVEVPDLMSREAIVPIATVLAIRSSIEPEQRFNRDRKHQHPRIWRVSKLSTSLKCHGNASNSCIFVPIIWGIAIS